MSANGQPRFSTPIRSTVCLSPTAASSLRTLPFPPHSISYASSAPHLCIPDVTLQFYLRRQPRHSCVALGAPRNPSYTCCMLHSCLTPAINDILRQVEHAWLDLGLLDKTQLVQLARDLSTASKMVRSRALHALVRLPRVFYAALADCFTFPPAQIAAEQRLVKFSKALGDF